MIELTVTVSSSSGNGYVLQSVDETIILEAGVHPSKVKEALSFNTKKVKGCFVSHVHGDHSKYVSLYERTFPVYANRHVIETYIDNGKKGGTYRWSYSKCILRNN